METVRFELAFERNPKTSVWKQSEGIALITRSVSDIHNDYHDQGERWIRRGNNDLYKAHASLSPDGLGMYLFVEVAAQPGTDAFNAALILILNTKMFGSYVSYKLKPSSVSAEVATLIATK